MYQQQSAIAQKPAGGYRQKVPGTSAFMSVMHELGKAKDHDKDIESELSLQFFDEAAHESAKPEPAPAMMPSTIAGRPTNVYGTVEVSLAVELLVEMADAQAFCPAATRQQ